MKHPVKIMDSTNVVELEVIRGKLEGCDVECLVVEKTFQGAGKLHQLIVAGEDKDEAMALIRESNPDAILTEEPVSETHHLPKKVIYGALIFVLIIFIYYCLKGWMLRQP